MWYGNATQSFLDEAESIANDMQNNTLNARIAGYAATAAIKRAKEQLAFKEAILSDREYPRELSPGTIAKREWRAKNGM